MSLMIWKDNIWFMKYNNLSNMWTYSRFNDGFFWNNKKI